jgi:hypothetical protein
VKICRKASSGVAASRVLEALTKRLVGFSAFTVAFYGLKNFWYKQHNSAQCRANAKRMKYLA